MALCCRSFWALSVALPSCRFVLFQNINCFLCIVQFFVLQFSNLVQCFHCSTLSLLSSIAPHSCFIFSIHGCCSSFTLSHLSNSHNTEKNSLSSEITVLEWHKTSIITFLNQRLENLNLPLHSSIKARWHHYKTVAYATMVWGRPSGPSIKLNGIEGWMEKKINASVCSEDPLTKPLNLYKKILFISKTVIDGRVLPRCCRSVGWLAEHHAHSPGWGWRESWTLCWWVVWHSAEGSSFLWKCFLSHDAQPPTQHRGSKKGWWWLQMLHSVLELIKVAFFYIYVYWTVSIPFFIYLIFFFFFGDFKFINLKPDSFFYIVI